jgi:uncharacterized protein
VSLTRTPPNVSEMTRPFWEAARDRRLVRPVCLACGHSFFSPQIACPRCLTEDWDYVESSGIGQVYSFSVVHRAPRDGFDPPYVVADIDMQEGWHLMSNIIGCDPDDVAVGMAVRVAWLDLEDGTVLPQFSPEEGGRP